MTPACVGSAPQSSTKNGERDRTLDPTDGERTGGPRPDPGSDNLGRTMRSLGRGTAVMMVATIVFVVFQFLTRVLVTHATSADEWGQFNVGFAAANLLALVAAFGIPTAVARSLAFEETFEARIGLVRKALSVSVPVGVVATAVVYLGAGDLASMFHTPPEVFQLFSLSVGLTMLSNVLVGIFQGLERAEPNAIFIQIINPSLFLVFAAGLLAFGWGFNGVLWGYILSWVGAFGTLAVYSYTRLPRLLRHLSVQTFTGDATARVSFAAMSITLFGVATLSYLTSYADTLLLAVFQPSAIVGQYSSAMNLTRLLLVGTGTVTFIYLPVTARLRRQRDFASIRETYVTVTRWMALLALPFTFIFLFDPTLSLRFTFGANQIGGASALQILVLSNTLAILLGPSTSTLGGLGEIRSVLRWTAVSTVANIGLCLVLIPTYGMIGAAIAWAVARLLFPGLSLIQLWVQHGIHPFAPHFLRPLALSAVVLSPLFYFVFPHTSYLWIPILVIVPALVFVGAILLTRSVDRGDIFFARAAERKFPGIVGPLTRLLESRTTAAMTEGSAWTGGAGPPGAGGL